MSLHSIVTGFGRNEPKEILLEKGGDPIEEASVLMIDDDREWCDRLRGRLDELPYLGVMVPVHTGKEGIETIELHKPDIIILDLVLPLYDGLYIIEYIESMREYRPIIYVVSMVGTERTNQLIRDRKSVHAYSVKPIQPDSVKTTLKALWAIKTNLREASLEATFINETSIVAKPDDGEVLAALIEDYLYQCGIGAANTQARCLRMGIEMCLMAEKDSKILLMDMYAEIGKLFKPMLSRAAVERRVRVAVDTIKEKRTPLFEKHFPADIIHVTNGAFIMESAGILRRQIQRYGNDSILVRKDSEVPSHG